MIGKTIQLADVVWMHLFYHDLHTALIQARGATAAVIQIVDSELGMQ